MLVAADWAVEVEVPVEVPLLLSVSEDAASEVLEAFEAPVVEASLLLPVAVDEGEPVEVSEEDSVAEEAPLAQLALLGRSFTPAPLQIWFANWMTVF